MSESEGIHRSVTWAIAGFLVFKLAINTIVRAIYPFLPAIARGLGISLPAAGALVSIRWAASMGAPFVVGAIGRRRPPTTLMVLGAALFSLGSIVTAATGVFVGAIFGFILLGVAKPLFDIGSTIWIAERVPFARRGRSFGFVEISWAGGLLVGAPMFGWLMERYGWTAPFWVIGLVTAAGDGRAHGHRTRIHIASDSRCCSELRIAWIARRSRFSSRPASCPWPLN